MPSNQMLLSNVAFFNINRKIIDERQYDSENITSHGSVRVSNGVASDFDTESYFSYSNLSFNDSKISISIEGDYIVGEGEQVAWFLAGDNPNISNLIFQFNNNRVTIIANSRIILEFKYMNFEDSTSFKSIVEVTKNSCKATINTRGVLYQESVELDIPISLPMYNKLYIGNDPTDFSEYWTGSLNLTTFKIEENNKLLYSPSISFPMSFTKVLMSDGTVPLTNSTTPVARHVYEFQIEELSRSGSTVLMVAHVGEDARLTIKEIGLYATTNEGQILFSIIKNLSIYKGEEVPYDLVFTVNLSLNFVNVVGFPNISSFLLESSPPAPKSSFKKAEDVIYWIITSLERIIDMNAEKIGYNRSQIFYRLNQDLEQDEDCYSNIQSYSKLLRGFKHLEEVILNQEALVITGDVEIDAEQDYIAFDFSNEAYISSNPMLPVNQNWEFNFSFVVLGNTITNILNNQEEVIGKESRTDALLTLVGYENTEDVDNPTTKSLLATITGKIFNQGTVAERVENYFGIKIQDKNTGRYIINSTNLFTATLDQKYYIKIVHTVSGSSHNYSVLQSEDGIYYSEMASATSSSYMSNISSLYVGVDYTYIQDLNTFKISNPFGGCTYLKDWRATYEDDDNYEWGFFRTLNYKDKALSQYYRLPNLPKESYKTRDINNQDCIISLLEDRLTGNKDLIDFSFEKGFTLCTKIDLKRSISPKILLAKVYSVESSDDPYFILAYLNQTLYFFLYTQEDVISVQKVISQEELSSYQEYPILLSIILDKKKNLLMYKNDELVSQFQGVFGNLKDAPFYKLTNKVSSDVLTDVCSNISLKDFTLEEYISQIEENTGKYVENIITFRGALERNDLYYMSNLLNCF